MISSEDRHQVYDLCKKYLSGKWSQIDEKDIIIESTSDGNINKLYICSLRENVDSEHNKVVVRFITPDFDDMKSDTQVLAMNLILSEKQFSPKLLGVFSVGTISQYIESRYFNYKDDLNQKRAEHLSRILANFHSLKMPIPKDTMLLTLFKSENPFFMELAKTYREVVLPQIEMQKYEMLTKVNFIEEMNWVREVIEDFKGPIVFSHNDFNKKNILVKETEGSEEIQIFLIDFDWSSYNYRGVDFGQYFSSWGQTEPDFGSGDFPTDEEMSVFIDSYIEEMCKIMGDSYAKQEINSRERLIKESKVFALLSFMKDYMYFIWQTPQNNALLAKAEPRLKCYADLKKRILQEYKF